MLPDEDTTEGVFDPTNTNNVTQQFGLNSTNCPTIDVSIHCNTLRKHIEICRACPRRVMVKAMDCGIEVSEFVFQSYYYVYFRANTLGKGMNLLMLPAMG